jgi:hypothetical protein
MADGIFVGVPRNALTFLNRFAAVTDASVVDLTFASVLPRVAQSECQIQNHTANKYLLVSLWFRHS